jgi:NAD(P)-dependent dehydrogenase (short-subunit alcohol dehydrogenase family)
MNSKRPLALVTGACRGIGAGIAQELALQGFDLALTDIASDGVEQLIRTLESFGAKAKLFHSDLAKIDTHESTIEAIVNWGGVVSCAVNNAGIPSPTRGDLLEVNPQAYDKVMDINLRGTFFFTQAVAKHMLSTPSATLSRTIVTVSSVSADMASIERAEYCVSKAGLGMLTKLFALRLAEAGIGVFEVRPGIIRTPMTETVASTYDQRIEKGLVPMRRWGYPVDIAKVVATLALGELVFSTGSVINVDGALSIPRL